MRLIPVLTAIMFTLKLLGMFHHGWLVVFGPQLAYLAVVAIAIFGKRG